MALKPTAAAARALVALSRSPVRCRCFGVSPRRVVDARLLRESPPPCGSEHWLIFQTREGEAIVLMFIVFPLTGWTFCNFMAIQPALRTATAHHDKINLHAALLIMNTFRPHRAKRPNRENSPRRADGPKRATCHRLRMASWTTPRSGLWAGARHRERPHCGSHCFS